MTFKNLSFQNDSDCLNDKFSVFNSSICLSLTLLFLLSVSTLNSNASLFSVRVLIFSWFSFISVSTLFKVIDNDWIFLYSLLVSSTCSIFFTSLSLSSFFKT